jgi:hypothetical protein
MMPGMGNICNLSTWERQLGGSQSGTQPGLQSLKKKKKMDSTQGESVPS